MTGPRIQTFAMEVGREPEGGAWLPRVISWDVGKLARDSLQRLSLRHRGGSILLRDRSNEDFYFVSIYIPYHALAYRIYATCDNDDRDGGTIDAGHRMRYRYYRCNILSRI